MKILLHPRFPAMALLAVLLSCSSGDSPTEGTRALAQLQPAAGAGQTGTVGTALGAPLVVRATDAGGRAVRGLTVYWNLTGGGTLSTESSETDAAGEARTRWSLGTRAGEQVVNAVVPGHPPVPLAAVAVAGPAAGVRISAGDAQDGVVGTTLAPAPTVRVVDRHDNPVQGAEVAWAVTSGGGSVSPPASRTDAAGLASARWTLGAGVGANGMSAAVAGLPGVAFTANATPPPVPARVEKSAGDVQTGVVGEALADSLAVRVVSAEGRPVPGVTVSWSTVEGALSSSSMPTDGAGISRVRWTLGGSAGTQGVEARVPGLSGSPVVFRATGKAGRAASVKKIMGDAQRGTVGLGLAQGLVVEAADRFGNPVEGARVTWTATGGGSVTGSSAVTMVAGSAGANWTLGPVEGAQTATVSVEGVTADFSATAVPFAPVASISLSPATGLVLAEGRTTGISATLLDAGGNQLGVRPVAWTVSAPGIVSVTSTSPAFASVTGLAAGRATITGSVEGRTASIAVTVLGAPKLTGFSRSPATVDVTSAAATVEFAVTATDAGSGVRSVGVSFSSPRQTRRLSCGASAPSSGTPASGVWKCSVTVPRGVDAETWFVGGVTLAGADGQTYVSGEQLAARGYPTSVTVTNSGPVATRPTLTSLSFSPATVDVTHANGRIEFTLSANASAGLNSVSAGAGREVDGTGYSVGCGPSTLVSGTAASGTWKCSLSVPMNYSAGTWSVWVGLTDNTGSSRSYDAEALRTAGFASSFVVTRSSADGTARRSPSRAAPRPGN
jgi:hypothetical protein